MPGASVGPRDSRHPGLTRHSTSLTKSTSSVVIRRSKSGAPMRLVGFLDTRLSKAKLHMRVFWSAEAAKNGRLDTFLGLADFDYILAWALQDIQLCICSSRSGDSATPLSNALEQEAVMKLVGLTAVLLIATAGVVSPTLAAPAASGAAMDEAKAIQRDYALGS